MSFSHAFSVRVAGHPLVAQIVIGKTQILAVKDELLVSADIHPGVTSFLTGQGFAPQVVTTLLAGLPNPAGVTDVSIVKVTLPKNKTIFDVTALLRGGGGPSHIDPRKVSPNHVIVPAYVGDQCPYGPPSPITFAPHPSPPLGPSERITIIDSGYIWDQSWVGNPLVEHSNIHLHRAQWVGHGGFTNFAANTGWQPGTPDVVDADGDGRLDALAGHANFVAGVIAQHTPMPEITIWNHNGGFVASSPELPTEAAACRSLIMSHLKTPSNVINFSFAFPAVGDVLSKAWDVVFDKHFLGTGPKAPRVVAPAGNQESLVARFPAALNYTYPGRYPNVIGVASLEDGLTASGFTNRGKWITASAVGSDVESMFLDVAMPVEDDSDPNFPKRNFTPNSWASWNGTCFAAPRVVAGIANRLAGNTPLAAWTYFKALGMPDPYGLVGLRFSL